MLTLNSHDVHRHLRSIALEAYPNQQNELRSFTVEVVAQERKTFHGDYHFAHRKIRIFNLSRPTAHIIKTSVHELAHHVDCCFYRRTGHDKQFYTTYKQLLETGHRMGILDLALVTDAIGLRDIAQLERSVGPLVFDAGTKKDGWLIKVDNAFKIKDELKSRGYAYSNTERVWLIECDNSILEDETGWLHQVIASENVRVIAAAENEIDSIYFCVMGKNGLFQHKEHLKADGFKFDNKHGWYKKVPAKAQREIGQSLKAKYAVEPKFRGSL